MLGTLYLGKQPATPDPKGRTIKLSTLLVPTNLPPLTKDYNIIQQFKINDNDVFGNNSCGDCVEAASAHMVLPFDKYQTGAQPNITTEDVTKQYFIETGGADNGLNMLQHLNYWRQNGLMFAGNLHKIFAFTEVDRKNHDEVKYSIMLLRGIYFGALMPLSAQNQFQLGLPWRPTSGSMGTPGSWGGHAMYGFAYENQSSGCLPLRWLKQRAVIGWTTTGPVCMTWGRPQQMSWDWWDKYVDEAYGIIDSIAPWANPATDPLNLQLCQSILQEITA